VSLCHLKAITTEEKNTNETFQIQSGLLTSRSNGQSLLSTLPSKFEHSDALLRSCPIWRAKNSSATQVALFPPRRRSETPMSNVET
jgi:hypothetical protein